MALFVQQNDNRSKLQQQVAAELAERAKKQAQAKPEHADGVRDSKYLEGTKQTTNLAWLWILLILIGLGLVIWLIIATAY